MRLTGRGRHRCSAKPRNDRPPRPAEPARRPSVASSLLRLRFHEELPIREIAARWQEDPARLHHEYATARDEFRTALRAVVAFHQPGPASCLDSACENLFRAIS